MPQNLILIWLFVFITACSKGPNVDFVIKNGVIYDGTGAVPYMGSVAINKDKIVYVGLQSLS